MATFRVIRLVTLGTLCAFAAIACAKATQSSSSPESTHTEPPRLLTRGSAPDIAVPESNAGGRATVRIRIQVLVDALGRADVRTLKLSGVVSTQDRIAIERWIESVTFRPAMRNGEAVSGVWAMTLAARVVRR
ncbi:MAG TPA: hypothetical protein VJ802_05110 [Gemmatimonadaceae bacterium]|nr:hypothetical protein [Gemmatimonadaceae bacterium]